ncbi:hypothetical protein V6N11_009397 [Hibiscus sabdariffa]|uniref:Uncharacterized protein n=1 Tax=Hibiscus sabdariffa TaxID=183260 RepID=A0ABR2NSW3_9ROSI
MQDLVTVQGRSSPRLYEVAGSQPLDGVPQVSLFPTLERPTSPTLLEQQRSSKKCRGNSKNDTDHDSMTVDDEQTVAATVLQADMIHNTYWQRDGDRSTYASKVAANGSAYNGANISTGFREDERRQPLNNIRGVSVGANKSKTYSRSRFEVLDVEEWSEQLRNEDLVTAGELAVHENDLHGIVGSKASRSKQIATNEAYKTSNPHRKSRSTKKGTHPVEVVPTVEGRLINVVEHVQKIVSESHLAIRIIEEGHSNAGTMRVSSTSIGRTGKVV